MTVFLSALAVQLYWAKCEPPFFFSSAYREFFFSSIVFFHDFFFSSSTLREALVQAELFNYPSSDTSSFKKTVLL